MVADGTLTTKNSTFELEVPGLKHPFILAGGPQASSLKKQSNLAGKRIQVAGKVTVGHGTSPPSLTADKFQPSQ